MEKTAAKAAEDLYLARIAKPRLQKTLVGNGNLRKLHRGPQHSCLLGAALVGWLDRAYLTDDHGFGTSLHAVHLTGGRHRRYGRSQKDFISGSTLACLHRDRAGDSMDGASAQPLPHSGKRVPLQRWFRVWLPGALVGHRRDGFRGGVGLCIYSRRNADGSLGDYRASVCSDLDSVGRSKLHLWRQRAGISSHVSGGSAVETGTYAIKPSIGELLRVVNDGDPLRALHSRDKDSSGPARVVLVLYCYYPVVDAGCRLEGITSSSFPPGISLHEYGRRFSHQRRFHHSVGTRQVFAATHHDLRESCVGLRLLSDGFCPSTLRVLSGCGARWHGVDPFCFRALGSKSTCDA